jgi:hypothetical protein
LPLREGGVKTRRPIYCQDIGFKISVKARKVEGLKSIGTFLKII